MGRVNLTNHDSAEYQTKTGIEFQSHIPDDRLAVKAPEDGLVKPIRSKSLKLLMRCHQGLKVNGFHRSDLFHLFFKDVTIANDHNRKSFREKVAAGDCLDVPPSNLGDSLRIFCETLEAESIEFDFKNLPRNLPRGLKPEGITP